MNYRTALRKNIALLFLIFVRIETKYDTLFRTKLYIALNVCKTHETMRLPIIVMTWYQLAKEQIYLFPDSKEFSPDLVALNVSREQIVHTNCVGKDVTMRDSRCCKMEAEFLYYYEAHRQKWFCHFEDSNYVNIPRLAYQLKKYNYDEDWYVGHRYLSDPEIVAQNLWYADVNAGVCISRSLMAKLRGDVIKKGFSNECTKLETLSETLGRLVNEAGVKLTHVSTMHSATHHLADIPTEALRKQVTLSAYENNLIVVPGYSEAQDPTRFLSLHCFLFPKIRFCRENHYTTPKPKREDRRKYEPEDKEDGLLQTVASYLPDFLKNII